MNDCLVSILVVTWNRRTEVRRALRSVLAQTWPRLEIVVVDNASTDGTAEQIRAEFPRVRLVRSERNLGCPSGRNLGFKHCGGRYIYMLDDDGWLKEDAVECCVRRAESDPAIGVVMARVHVIADGFVVGQYPVEQPFAGYRADFSGGCSLIRREALAVAGPFPDDYFRQGEEANLSLRLLEAGYFCFHEPAAVMFHAMSPTGRDGRALVFHTLDNSNKTALRLWPMPWGALRPLMNFGHALRHARHALHRTLPFRLLASLVAELWSLPRRRRGVAPATFRLFKQLEAAPVPQRPARPTPGSAGEPVEPPSESRPAACAEPLSPHVHS